MHTTSKKKSVQAGRKRYFSTAIKNRIGFVLLYLSVSAFSQGLTIGSAEEVYSPGFISRQHTCNTCSYVRCEIAPWYDDRGWPDEWMADGVVSYLRKDANTVITFWPSPNRIQRYGGPLNDPRTTYNAVPDIAGITYHFGWAGLFDSPIHFEDVNTSFLPQTAAVYLHNIYKVPTTNGLIGFTHNEKFDAGDVGPRYYSIGIVYSDGSGDLGENWTYLGKIIRPNENGDNYNINGVPYLVVGEYFYIYYKEVQGGVVPKYCVARAKVNDVIQNARAGTVGAWQKLNGVNWTATSAGLGGVATSIFSEPNGWCRLDLHTDAVHFTSLKNEPYLMLANGYRYNSVTGVGAVTTGRQIEMWSSHECTGDIEKIKGDAWIKLYSN
jgi:hypothetical protein